MELLERGTVRASYASPAHQEVRRQRSPLKRRILEIPQMSFQYVPGRYRTTESEVAGEDRRGEKQARARAEGAEGSGDGRRLGRPAVGRVAVIVRCVWHRSTESDNVLRNTTRGSGE